MHLIPAAPPAFHMHSLPSSYTPLLPLLPPASPHRPPSPLLTLLTSTPGTNPVAGDKHGFTALHWAVPSTGSDSVPISKRVSKIILVGTPSSTCVLTCYTLKEQVWRLVVPSTHDVSLRASPIVGRDAEGHMSGRARVAEWPAPVPQALRQGRGSHR